ncbi:quercetin 2,3-dioxygenase [Halobacteriovorax marinus]|uniref:Quercetin 2,3-dioxygenase n=1 Tax=Halobacteriovorax marinus TaxID=97084 RepID=A0A1Y5F5F8_9BACT|nr:quercetin 2,3-dioxygenase [Halobacteriovorax marinus]
MLELRKANDRGYAQHGWLKSWHSFSFASYYDPKFLGFRDLLVINEDHIDGGQGFGTHPHKDMEIISYLVEGALEHRDSQGHSAVTRPGEIQVMSAGTGIRHSEFNAKKDDVTHMYQIWIQTEKVGLPPRYDQKDFSKELNSEELVQVVGREKDASYLRVNQDIKMWVGKFKDAKSFEFSLSKNNAWLQLVKGQMNINNREMQTGDGMAISQLDKVNIKTSDDAEFFIIELT